jgi:hypothetical protein
VTIRLYLIVGLMTLAVVGGGYVYASPYLTVSQVRQAAARGDAETVNAHVDFPALRESFKGWMGAAMVRELSKQELRDNPFQALGAALAMTMMEKMVDVMVTPEMVRMMLQGQRPQGPQPPGPGSRGEPRVASQSDPEMRMGYEAYDRFVVTVRSKARPQDEFSMVWRRSGLTWKLTAVRLPVPER